MLIVAFVALTVGALFAALWWRWRMPGTGAAALAWLAYAPYEWAMHARVLCSGECNIRVDLLLFWPVLLCLSLAVPIRWARQRRRRIG